MVVAKKIITISGKGGSGKTSYSLALAKVLSKSSVRVLLIDCDMSTHGSTFFMKSVIEKYRKNVKHIVSVDDILVSSKIPPFGFFLRRDTSNYESDLTKLVPVDNNFYFLPSNISISSTNLKKNIAYFETFNSCIKDELERYFDVIIFDCQAGYSDFTRYLATMSNTAILVTLPDPVSAAANKALFFQLGIELEDVPTYQVFNQLTEEEVVSYEKITTSAFLTNLPPLLYSFDVRRSFMRLQIPSFDTCEDFDYNKKILFSLYTLFPELNEQLDTYKNDLYNIMQKNCENRIQIIRQEEKKKKRNSLFSIVEIVMVISTLFISLIFVAYNNFFDSYYENNFFIIYICLMYIFIISVVCFLLIKKYLGLTLRNEELDKLKEELYEISTRHY